MDQESDWKKFNREKKIYQKALCMAKGSHIGQEYMKTKGIWNFIPTITGWSSISIPTILIDSAKKVTSNTNLQTCSRVQIA